MSSVEIPKYLRGRPVDHRGFVVPYFVAWFRNGRQSIERDGVPDFTITDEAKLVRCIRLHRCWICGQPLGVPRAFVLGTMCVVNRTNSEPPSHRACAVYALRVCPFLAKPNMRRLPTAKPEATRPAPGLHLERNPGVHALWIARGAEPFRAHVGQDGWLFRLYDPIYPVEWWREGRPATRAEVEASIASGMPALEAVARQEGNGAVEALAQLLVEARAYLPPETDSAE